ncbi:MAG: hypothetical protein J6S44_04210 [Clostridia bacterium]|nr:hypothetical protein [Clostridia bacterium]MBO5754978.1 hypothetical protein [Clostridia bacterium]
MKTKKIALFLVLLLLLTVALSVAVSAEDMYDPNSADPGDIAMRIVIGFAIGFVIALIIVLVMARKMSTVRPAKTADGYVKKNSFRLTESRDIYLYSRVTRVRVNTSNNKR